VKTHKFPRGFVTFFEFLHLQDLASQDSVRWLNGYVGQEWRFGNAALPRTLNAYRHYLDNVADFVAAKNTRIRDWCDERQRAGAIR
jgi:hypothetical protein